MLCLIRHTGVSEISHLRAPTGEAIAVQVGDTPCQRAAQHLQLLPADHVMCQVLLEGREMMGWIVF